MASRNSFNVRIGVPDPNPDESLLGLDVKVEPRGVNVLGPLVTKLYTGMGLVRALVAGESCVAVNPEKRATGFARIGYKVRADLLEPRLERLDELEQWLAEVALVAVFVFLEPCSVVVLGELTKEL